MKAVQCLVAQKAKAFALLLSLNRPERRTGSRSSLDFATSTARPKALQSARNLKSLDITFGRQELVKASELS